MIIRVKIKSGADKDGVEFTDGVYMVSLADEVDNDKIFELLSKQLKVTIAQMEVFQGDPSTLMLIRIRYHDF